MLKLGLQVTENDKELGIKLIDPTKKQLEEATEQEKIIAQAFKEVFDEYLLSLLEAKLNGE